MADIAPLRPLRYANVAELANLVAPPYDVISPEEREELVGRSPHNIARLILPEGLGDERYGNAAALLAAWRHEGVLMRDEEPAFYRYDQSFEPPGGGARLHRRGLLALVRLVPFSERVVLPHERTLSGPKEDRLKLFRSTRTNLSPGFMLYRDPQRVLDGPLAKAETLAEFATQDGIEHQLAKVSAPEAVRAIIDHIRESQLLIADGHHRYETGLRYRDDLAAAGQLSGPDDPANFVLMMLVGMSDPGLQILPTHRLVSGFPGLTSETLAERLSSEFDVTKVGSGETGCRAAWEAIELADDQETLGFGTVADGQWLTARLRSYDRMDALAPDQSADWRALGVSVLSELVLKTLLSDLGKPSIEYVHLVDEVLQSVSARGCDLACLVPPAGMGHVEAIASNLEKMPPKSTYFYPKLLTGLVFNPLR